MRFRYFFLFFMFPFLLQAQLQEHFSYNSFEEATLWNGDKSFFKLSSSSAIPANMRPALQLRGDSTKNTTYISTPVDLEKSDSTVWEFWVKLSFTPSSNNYARIYLFSKEENLTQANECYFVSFGEKERNISLYKKTGNETFVLIEGSKLNKTTNVTRCRVKQNNEKEWSLWIDTIGNKDFILQGNANDVVDFAKGFFGIYCTFTKSHAEKMYFDDIEIQNLIPDTVAPKIDSFKVELPNLIHLCFSEEINKLTAENKANYLVNNNINEPVSVYMAKKRVTLHFSPFQSGVKYSLKVSNIKDVYGNKIQEQKLFFFFYNLKFNDIIINELLSHPYENGAKFVEIYNRTAFDIPLKDLFIATLDKTTGHAKTMIRISDTAILKSHDYRVVTTLKEGIIQHYTVLFPEKIIELKSLPSFPNAEGVVVLALADSTIIDRFDYSEKMHFPLLKTKTGVSLERRSFDRPTNEAGNWQSAAESATWATPTYKSSQQNDYVSSEEISIKPEIFSPNNDGIDDILNIYYHLDKDGYTANINIYDVQGRLVERLQSNTLLGTEGVFVWNGLNRQGRKAPIGHYIIFIEIFDLQGNTKHFKKTVVLAG